MNSAEQKDFENVSPTQPEVADTAASIQKILSDPTLSEDLSVGYLAAYNLITLGAGNFEAPENPSVQSTRILAAAIDYMDGKITQEDLLSFVKIAE